MNRLGAFAYVLGGGWLLALVLGGCTVKAPSPAATPFLGSACAAADQARLAGLLDVAEKRYTALLEAPKTPSPTPVASPSPQPSAELTPEPQPNSAAIMEASPSPPPPTECAAVGLRLTVGQRAAAAHAVANGELAQAAGDLDTAEAWYGQALVFDVGSKEAAAGLTAVQQRRIGGRLVVAAVGATGSQRGWNR
jgi:hypothetical protein